MAESKFQRLNVCRTMRWWDWLLAVGLVILPNIGGFIGAFTISTEKYNNGEMRRPDWAPPPAVFGPMWTFLYLSMGLASFLVYKLGDGLHVQTIVPLGLYFLQLILNWIWTPIFFGSGNFSLALMILGIILGLVVACIATFAPMSKIAAALMVPYLVWLCVAGTLNYDIVNLNGPYLNFTLPMSI